MWTLLYKIVAIYPQCLAVPYVSLKQQSTVYAHHSTELLYELRTVLIIFQAVLIAHVVCLLGQKVKFLDLN